MIEIRWPVLLLPWHLRGKTKASSFSRPFGLQGRLRKCHKALIQLASLRESGIIDLKVIEQVTT
jgi:hypothetical protein